MQRVVDCFLFVEGWYYDCDVWFQFGVLCWLVEEVEDEVVDDVFVDYEVVGGE